MPLHGQSNSQFIGVSGLSGTCFPLLLWKSSPPRNTLFLGPSPLIIPNGIAILPFLYGSQMLCYTMHCQWGRTVQNCLFPWDFVTLPSHGMHQKFGKDRACAVWFRRCLRGQTERQSDTHTDILIIVLCKTRILTLLIDFTFPAPNAACQKSQYDDRQSRHTSKGDGYCQIMVPEILRLVYCVGKGQRCCPLTIITFQTLCNNGYL